MRTKKGVITSAKMTGTVTVIVHRAVVHPLYQKRYRMSKKFLADTNSHDLWVGDEVVITECRPLSKRKCFKVTEILKKAARVSELKEESSLEGLITKKKEEKESKEVSPAKS
ncbi:30S ribosomal protein S17 [Candidatus Peribacteria bacterium RIFCSPHIGHO2_02_FULL_52_16]|nr:MAG: 30S ribosomal protein S17 [Candidatus Peribacteria bacterium RIFCSPHIGHO2_01_FULL_51_35]OGJ61457.1 MAG: 30S ribosomal protein S17 [Candidatus Peribacteria bacterium RIFCSPHIGHO2_02_FULL_52_16]